MDVRDLRAGVLGLMLLAGCGDTSDLPQNADIGPEPAIPEPNETLIPTVNIAPAKGWPTGALPLAADGLTVTEFAAGLDHPRWLYVLPNGDVLVAESNAPPKESGGVMTWIMGLVQKRAGAKTPSANRITLLRDEDGDGTAEFRSILLQNLNSPFGMALVDGQLYVANTDAVVRFPYREGETQIDAAPVTVAELPAGEINHHWTKNIIASPDGTLLYATVGSNSNAAENGIENEVRRAAILEIERETGSTRLFASGLRNPNGLDWQPETGALWTVVNERDELGSDLVPDYLTSVRDGGFYGWPYSYWGQHVDERVEPPNPDLVASAIVPDYAVGNHVAPLGLVFSKGDALPPRYRDGAFIGLHGSWNREPLSGYKVIFVPFSGGEPSGQPLDVLTGFVNDAGDAYGRPVGVVIDKAGALLVADDVGNVVWRVSAAAPTE